MKDKFLQMAGVNSEEEFYSMFPTEEAFFQAYPEAREMKKGGNVPTNPELYSRVKSEAKSKFDRWPSAYGSAWLVKTYKSRGGGYRKAQTGGSMGQEMFQYPNYGSLGSYYDKVNEYNKNNIKQPVTNFLKNGIMAIGQGMNNGEGDIQDKLGMAKLAMSFLGMPAMGMGGVGMMMRDNYYDEGGEMAVGQVMAMHDKLSRLENFINAQSEVEPWVASKLTLADDYISSVADYLQFNEGAEEEEDIDMNMGEMEQMKMGGIPERYKNRGFTKVGAKRESDRAGKKWMVLAKKGDKYKIVHGGYTGMKDFSQHGSQKRKDNFWNRMGGKNSAKATDPFSPLYWHKRFGTWAKGGEMMPPEIARARFAAAGNLDKLDDYGYAKGGEPQNAGFQALPPYVQAKILSNMAEGGTYSSAPINTFMSPGIDNDPRFEQYYNQQLQQLNKAGVKQVPSRNDVYSYYQSANPRSVVDQTGRMFFSSAPGTISSSTTFTQAVDPKTGKVLNQGSNLEKAAFDQQARRFQEGGPALTEEQKAAAAEAAAKKKKRNDTMTGIGLGIGTAAGVIASEIRAARKQRGYEEFMNSNDPRLGTGQYPSNKELRKMGRRMYGGDIDMYGGQMDMDAMYNMMKGGSTFSGNAWYGKGGQPCYECGGNVYQEGGQQDEVMQAIQMYAQMTQTDPEQLMAQLQSLPPLEQQEVIQKIMQAIQEAQTGQMKNGGMYNNLFNFAKTSKLSRKKVGGMTEGAELELHPDEIQALIDQGYGIEYLD